jgi:hypothetical protein
MSDTYKTNHANKQRNAKGKINNQALISTTKRRPTLVLNYAYITFLIAVVSDR